jgi:hypothetical protein
MASGHRKRKAGIVRTTLTSAGLTNYLPADQGNTINTGKVVATALYGSGAVGATFTEGSTTVLSDAASNADGNWTLMGYAGETSANAAGFFKSNTSHRYIPYPGTSQVTWTDTTPVVIYSKDGPQGYYDPAYLPTAAQVNGSSSLFWAAANITQSAGALSKLKVWIAGAVPTGAVGTTVTVLTGSPPTSVLLTFSASSTPLMQTASFNTSSIGTGIKVVFSSSANTYNLNSFVPGVLVYISGSAT